MLILTDSGRALRELAEGIFRAYRQLQDGIGEIGTGYAGTFTLACTNTVASRILSPVLAKLRVEHPALRPVLRIGNSETIREWLRGGQVDLGIFVDDGGMPRDFTKRVLRSGRYVLFRGPGTKNYSGLVVTRGDREEVRHYQRQLAKHGLAHEIECEITSWEAIKSYVAHSAARGIGPDYILDGKTDRVRVVKTPFAAPTYELVGVHLSRRPPGRNARLVLDLLGGEDPVRPTKASPARS